MRAAMRDIGASLLVGDDYAGLLESLLGYVDVIHWRRIAGARNRLPRENPGGFAPVYLTADFVLFDVEQWMPKLPAGLLALLDAGLEPTPKSGKQEHLERIVNEYV